MIAINIYSTYGMDCEDMRFVRKGSFFSSPPYGIGHKKWQRVITFGPFYWPRGEVVIEHECNYYKSHILGFRLDSQ